MINFTTATCMRTMEIKRREEELCRIMLEENYSIFFEKYVAEMSDIEFFIYQRIRNSPLSRFNNIRDLIKFYMLDHRTKVNNIVWLRQIAFYVLYKRGLSSPEIGKLFKRDHATVLHGRNVTQNRLEINDKEFVALYKKYYELLYTIPV